MSEKVTTPSATRKAPSTAAEEKKMPNVAKFAIGGLSGMTATAIVQPQDLIKTRMQVDSIGKGAKCHGFLNCLQTVVKNEGVLALYKGLSAGLMRQATYTTSRLGSFSFISEWYGKKYGEANLYSRMTIGLAAGAIGALAGTPADLVLIRMTADGRLPLEQRRNYKGVFNALLRIAREEGIPALWRGCVPTIGRAMVVNTTQLGSYSQIKSTLLHKYKMKDGLQTHFAASMISGVLTVVASLPVDMAKTRIQNMKVIDGKPEYKGLIDVVIKVVRYEGFFSLWKGFFPYYIRLAPHTVLTFIFVEQFSILYHRYVMGVEYKTSDL